MNRALAGDADSERIDSVLVERIEEACVITINRPHVRNAVDSEVSALIGAALEAAEADPGIRSVILTGTGDAAFCAGADLNAISRGEGIHAPDHEEWSFGGYVNHPVSKPTIAAVNGAAIGGGMELVLASDLVVSTRDARFGLAEARRGVVAGGGGALRLPQRIPHVVAMEMLFTGMLISAQRALDLHLVNRVVEPGGALVAALELAREIALSAPNSVRAHKRIALGRDENGYAELEGARWSASRAESARARGSEDAREGARAFLEKRRPQWNGA